MKIKSYDALTNTTLLKSEWISKTSATQRAGRAGRCQPGKVYRLFSSVVQSNMSQFTTPEILRTSLLSLCLQTKLLAPPNTPISDFLAKVPGNNTMSPALSYYLLQILRPSSSPGRRSRPSRRWGPWTTGRR